VIGQVIIERQAVFRSQSVTDIKAWQKPLANVSNARPWLKTTKSTDFRGFGSMSRSAA
jgi:hypothetical protein